MFTIEDAIERCKHIAEENSNMPKTASEWKQIAKWLEALWYAPDTIKMHDFRYAMFRPDDNIYDMRSRQREMTIEETIEILEGLSK